jgi:hypothetical protein
MDLINWRKATYSSGNGGNCIEAGSTGSAVTIRDTKQEHAPRRDVLTFTSSQWRAFIGSLKKS